MKLPFVCIFIFVTALTTTNAQTNTNTTTTTPPWRVICRKGQPPLNDYDESTKACTGLFADIFTTAAKRGNIPFTVTPKEGDIDKYISQNTSSSSSVVVAETYDVVITFHTITPERLTLYDFSSTILQSEDRIILQPRFMKASGTMSGSIIRAPVFYLFSIVAIFIGIVAIVILITEPFEPKSAIQDLPWYRRILWAMEMAFEAVAGGMTTDKLYSQVSRSLSKVAAIAAIFVLSIFSAVITSKLTATSLADVTPSLKELRGRTIVVASSTLEPFLEENYNMKVQVVSNMNTFARDFFNGGHADVDGISTSSEVLQYLYDLNDGRKKGFVMSEPFTLSGTYDLKAFPINRNFSAANKLSFDLQIENMRSDGTISDLITKYLSFGDSSNGLGDVPVDIDAELGLRVANGLIFGIGLLAFAILAVRFHIHQYFYPSTEKNNENSSIHDTELSNSAVGQSNNNDNNNDENLPSKPSHPPDAIAEAAFTKSTLTFAWRGKVVAGLTVADEKMLDAFVALVESRSVLDASAVVFPDNA